MVGKLADEAVRAVGSRARVGVDGEKDREPPLPHAQAAHRRKDTGRARAGRTQRSGFTRSSWQREALVPVVKRL